MTEPKSFHDAVELAKKWPTYEHALTSSLKHYKGCPACEWRGGACGQCGTFRRHFLAEKKQCA